MRLVTAITASFLAFVAPPSFAEEVRAGWIGMEVSEVCSNQYILADNIPEKCDCVVGSVYEKFKDDGVAGRFITAVRDKKATQKQSNTWETMLSECGFKPDDF